VSPCIYSGAEVIYDMAKSIDFGTVADLYDLYVEWDEDVPFFREICAGGRFEPATSPYMIWELGSQE
jgi:hypothetical protein